ncbi:MAG: MATE family efflux transporter [archaeon]
MENNRVAEFIKNPKKALYILSAPVIVAMFVQTMYNIVDTAFVGRLGAGAIAALTFAFPIFFILISINAGLSIGMGSRISRLLGANQKEEAENTALHGIIISTILAIILTAIGLLTLKPMFLLFGATEDVMKLSTDYMSIILMGMFFMFTAYVLSSIFSSQGDTKTPMKVQVIGLVLNGILDPIFIYTLKLGVKGAAIATVISFIVTMILFIYYLKKKSYLQIKLKSFKYSKTITKDIFKVGMPAAFMMLTISIYVIFINGFMAHFGTEYVAAFGLASRLESLAIMPIVAFSLASVTLVGMFYGAKRHDLLKEISWYGIKIGVLFTIIIGVILAAIPTIFLKIFTNDPNLLRIAAAYLRIDTITFPLMAIGVMVSRITQGMGYGMPGFVIQLARVFGGAIPLAYIFVFILGYGYLSVAVAMVLGGVISSIIALIWLNTKLKKINQNF